MEVSSDGVNHYLGQSETILWSGFPLTNIHFIAWDVVAVPFCLFVIFILLNNFSNGHFDVIGLIFFGILLYLTFGRFVNKYYNKKRTLYFLTNERIIIFDKSKNQIIQEQDLRSIKHISKKVSPNGATGWRTFSR